MTRTDCVGNSILELARRRKSWQESFRLRILWLFPPTIVAARWNRWFESTWQQTDILLWLETDRLQHKVLPVFCRTFIIFAEEPGTKVILGNIASWPCQPILSLWMFYAGKCVYFSCAEFFITILQQPLTSSAGPRATLGNIGQGSPVDKVISNLQASSPQLIKSLQNCKLLLPAGDIDIFCQNRHSISSSANDKGCFLFNPDSWPQCGDHMDTKKKSFDLFP